MTDDDTRPAITRRQFLETTGTTTLTAVAGSMLLGRAAPAEAGRRVTAPVLGANDRIRVGLVGVKGMGGGHIKHILQGMPGENVEIAAVCDVWEKARLSAQAAAQLADDQVYSDYRRMLDRKDLDAVLVATPDHWHAPISIAAMESGRDVYVEKPMTRRLDEAFRMLDVAKRTGRRVQLGTQGCTDPRNHRAREVVRSGALGRLLWAQASYCRHNPVGEWNYAIDPELTEQTVDWKAWLGSAPKRPFSPERYFRWRKYWDYGTGVLGDLLPHRVAPLLFVMDLHEYPQTVSCVGGNLVDTDRGPGPDGQPYGERREVGDTFLITVQFPSGVMLFLASGTANERGVEDVVRGNKANLVLGGGKVLLEPERPWSDEIERVDEVMEEVKDVHPRHVRNFFQALRGAEKLNCVIDEGVRIQTIVSMAEKSFRERRMVHFDPASRKMRT